MQTLGQIEDPEIGLPITELGLVYEVTVGEDGAVEVIYTLTSMGCPVGPAIDARINELTADVAGVTAVKTRIVFQPPWTPEKMSDEAKMALGYL